tara:strand:- start:58 stop:600 length:543 start_codon:yes stop_codon:yes gene_type:complete
MDFLKDIIESISSFDLIYLVITFVSLLQGLRKGFVLSLLSASKWLLAYIITLVIFPKIKPYVKDTIDNEYILDLVLGVSIFIVIIFLVLLINKGISKVVKYSGLGKLDTAFGFLFGFVKAYVLSVCIFATINIVYNSDKWPIDKKKSFAFSYVEKGSIYLIKEFPNKKNYEDAKEKVTDT